MFKLLIFMLMVLNKIIIYSEATSCRHFDKIPIMSESFFGTWYGFFTECNELSVGGIQEECQVHDFQAVKKETLVHTALFYPSSLNETKGLVDFMSFKIGQPAILNVTESSSPRGINFYSVMSKEPLADDDVEKRANSSLAKNGFDPSAERMYIEQQKCYLRK